MFRWVLSWRTLLAARDPPAVRELIRFRAIIQQTHFRGHYEKLSFLPKNYAAILADPHRAGMDEELARIDRQIAALRRALS
jgi:hypothetical protein